MTVRKLDEKGDIVTQGAGFTSGLEEVEQTIRTRLHLFLGEYFRDITDGTPWFEQIIGKGTSLDIKEAVLRARIARTPNVIRLTSFSTEFDVDTRKYTVTAGALTTYGLVTVTENG